MAGCVWQTLRSSIYLRKKKNYPKDCGETKSRRYNNAKAYFYKTVQSRTNKTAKH